MEKHNKNHNHFIMEIEDTLNKNAVVNRCYFDGTQAQAFKYFKAHRLFRQYAGNDRYLISFRGNSVILQDGRGFK